MQKKEKTPYVLEIMFHPRLAFPNKKDVKPAADSTSLYF